MRAQVRRIVLRADMSCQPRLVQEAESARGARVRLLAVDLCVPAELFVAVEDPPAVVTAADATSGPPPLLLVLLKRVSLQRGHQGELRATGRT